MSTAEILSLISLICYIIAGVSFALAVFFWIFFKIPAVIGDLSGRTAKKSIARRRASNEHSGGKGYQPSATNASRGKLTDTMQHSRKLKAEAQIEHLNDETLMPETGLLETNKAEIVDSQQTELLDGEATSILVDEDGTVMLQEEPAKPIRTGGKKLTMLEDIVLIHTDEVI